jgi:sulfite exporter TauE/SafE
VILALLTGLLAGALHVLGGPDHLAAIAPFAARASERPGAICAGLGARWGLGHSAGVALVAALALAVRDRLPLEALGARGERAVGVVLLAIGIWGLRRALSNRVHVHVHRHDGRVHAHVHVHARPAPARPQAQTEEAHVHTHAAFAVGSLHGLAGGAHFLGVLPALALPSLAASATYLAGFAAGTIGAMAGFSALVALSARRLESARLRAGWLAACSTAALATGLWWLCS